MNCRKLFCAAILSGGALFAQEWEVGLIGGFGYSPKVSVDSPAGHARAGFGNGAAVGAYGGDDTYRYFGGEARYLYRFGDLKATAGGKSESLGASTHILTGDILAYFRPRETRVRPFIAFGGGAKIIDGT